MENWWNWWRICFNWGILLKLENIDKIDEDVLVIQIIILFVLEICNMFEVSERKSDGFLK